MNQKVQEATVLFYALKTTTDAEEPVVVPDLKIVLHTPF